MFVLRQLNNKINTNIVSMTVICLMLFMTISALSSSLSVQSALDSQLEKFTPVDVNLYKTAYLPESYVSSYSGKTIYNTETQIEDSRHPVSYTLETNGYDMNNLKDIVEIPIYAIPEWTMKTSLGDYSETAMKQFSMLPYDTPETVIKISDYNKIASLYGNEQYSLNDDEYMVLCDFEQMINLRNEALKENSNIQINGKTYHSKYNECKNGFVLMSTSNMNAGIILVPDSFEVKEENTEQYFLVANYNARTEEEKIELNDVIAGNVDSELLDNVSEKGINLEGMTKISLKEASKGLSTIIIFIAIYLGIVFLIASSAIIVTAVIIGAIYGLYFLATYLGSKNIIKEED